MIRLRLCVLAAMSFLAACATTPLDTGKALAGAWASLDAAATSAVWAAKTGRLKGSAAAQVAQDLQTASAALQIATQAYRGLDATHDPAAEILAATTAVAEILALTGGAPQ